jgi:COP9 signalosome complex subunit 7
MGFVITANETEPTGNRISLVVTEVLKHPQIYVFGELLQHPNVQALASTHKPLLDLLGIFASGTYADYLARSDLPKISKAEKTKLQRLSLVSLAADAQSLSYQQMMDELKLTSVRQLENLIIDAVCLGIIEGQLDPEHQIFQVQYAMGRDTSPSEIDTMLAKLRNWLRLSADMKQQLLQCEATADTRLGATKELEKKISEERANMIAAIRTEKKENSASSSRAKSNTSRGHGRQRMGFGHFG